MQQKSKYKPKSSHQITKREKKKKELWKQPENK